jgi:hypothetical protein
VVEADVLECVGYGADYVVLADDGHFRVPLGLATKSESQRSQSKRENTEVSLAGLILDLWGDGVVMGGAQRVG